MYLGKNILTNLYHVAITLADADMDDDGKTSVEEMFDTVVKGIKLTAKVVHGELEPHEYDREMYALTKEIPEAAQSHMVARMSELSGQLGGTGAGARLQQLQAKESAPEPGVESENEARVSAPYISPGAPTPNTSSND